MRQQDIFIVAYYHQKPKDPARTKEKGYMSDPDNISYDESINITRGIKTKDQLNAAVILNLTKQSVVKNRFRSDADFPSLLAYYQEGYPNYINKIIAGLYAKDLENIDGGGEDT